MFANSSQKKYWLFSSENKIEKLRYEAIQGYINIYSEKFQGYIESLEDVFLTPFEEKTLHNFYLKKLWDFYNICFYKVPKSIVDIAFTYYKRFYLTTSVMDFHPKEILLTCFFLACKVDEYNISLPKFLTNIKGDVKKLSEVIISHEGKIIEKLNFQLVVHTPYRPLEGFFIDIKTRFPSMKDADKLRIGSQMFLDTLSFTNACFLFSPSQIALASLVYSSHKIGENLDNYVELLYEDATMEDKFNLKNSLQKVEECALKSIFFKPDDFKSIDTDPKYAIIETKLRKCQNPQNNPTTSEFAKKIRYETGLDEISVE